MDEMTPMRILRLDSQGLEELPASIANNPAILHLSAYNNVLTTLPDWLWSLTDLQTLNVSANRLTSVSQEIGLLRHLRMLDGHNQIASLPDAIGHLQALTDFLYLSDNSIEHLPATLTGDAVRYLSVTDNRLVALPHDLGKMVGLVELRAYRNPLMELPASIGMLVNLRELHLDQTTLTTLPETIGGLRNLRVLSLRGCKLTELPASIGELNHLRHLDLRGNSLTELPDGIAKLPNLEKFDLRWNHQLKRLPTWVETLEARGCVMYV
jgi:Leucine-rich repeat (LRR) protein